MGCSHYKLTREVERSAVGGGGGGGGGGFAQEDLSSTRALTRGIFLVHEYQAHIIGKGEEAVGTCFSYMQTTSMQCNVAQRLLSVLCCQ